MENKPEIINSKEETMRKMRNCFTVLLLLMFFACQGQEQVKKKQHRSTRPQFQNEEARARYRDSMQEITNEYFKVREKYELARKIPQYRVTIDENTGKVSGTDKLMLVGEIPWNDNAFNHQLSEGETKKFQDLSQQKRKADYRKGDEFNPEDYSNPWGIHLSGDGRYVVVTEGMVDAGDLVRISFYSREGKLLRVHDFPKAITPVQCEFNTTGTYFLVNDCCSGEFIFFYPDGKVLRKGQYNELTGDNGGSYGRNLLSENGLFWVLDNNLRFVYNKDTLLDIIKVNLISINNDGLIFCHWGNDLIIYNPLQKIILFQFNKSNINRRSLIGNKIQIQFENNKSFEYEIVK